MQSLGRAYLDIHALLRGVSIQMYISKIFLFIRNSTSSAAHWLVKQIKNACGTQILPVCFLWMIKARMTQEIDTSQGCARTRRVVRVVGGESTPLSPQNNYGAKWTTNRQTRLFNHLGKTFFFTSRYSFRARSHSSSSACMPRSSSPLPSWGVGQRSGEVYR